MPIQLWYIIIIIANSDDDYNVWNTSDNDWRLQNAQNEKKLWYCCSVCWFHFWLNQMPEVDPLSLTVQHLLPVFHFTTASILHPPKHIVCFNAAVATQVLSHLFASQDGWSSRRAEWRNTAQQMTTRQSKQVLCREDWWWFWREVSPCNSRWEGVGRNRSSHNHGRKSGRGTRQDIIRSRIWKWPRLSSSVNHFLFFLIIMVLKFSSRNRRDWWTLTISTATLSICKE